LEKTCSKCILSEKDDPDLTFDENGICDHCRIYDFNINKFYEGDDLSLHKFNQLISAAKQAGQNTKYDVLIGLSGGVDSTYVAYLCWKYNLRALAVHLDNGWNSELSVVNVKNILKVTGFDLYTHVINWEEFRDLQRSYFKANVVDIEALTDHAIGTILYKTAKSHNIKYIFNGSSITTEGRLPKHWVYNKIDSINIRAIQKRFGTKQIKTFPIGNIILDYLNPFRYKVNNVSILDYYPYNKPEAKKLIQTEFSWRDYGGKHYESIFTRFYQAYILPQKFNIDKRKSHYSTLICAGQLSREEAIELMKQDTYTDKSLEKSDYIFVLKKLGFTEAEFNQYITSPRIEHTSYNSIENYYNMLRPFYRFIKYTILKHKKA
jgi:N-acetyl sugar amidotransferase